MSWSIVVVCTVAIPCSPRALRTMSRPLERGALTVTQSYAAEAAYPCEFTPPIVTMHDRLFAAVDL
jgi:hypothetical protein